MNEAFQHLYKTIILPHSRQPKGYRKRAEAQFQLEAYNPICGDRYKVYVDLDAGKIAHLHFYGHGCAISKAAGSVLTNELEGLSLIEAQKKTQLFLQTVDASLPLPELLPDSIRAFSAARDFPERKKCAILMWEALSLFLASNT